jgi:type IV pilus assembly protein PilB
MRKKLKLGELLVNRGLIDEQQLAAALEEHESGGKRLGMTLVRLGYLDEEDLVQTLANQLKLPVARIRGKQVDHEVIELVEVDLAEKHRCLPLFLKPEGGSRNLYLAMEDPSDEEAREEIARRIGLEIRPVLVSPTELEDALQRHYHWAGVAGVAAPLPLAADQQEPAEAAEPDRLGLAPVSGLPLMDRSPMDGSLPDLELPPAPAPQAERTPEAEGGVTPELILRALSQLLVEKGLITRDELVDRLDALARDELDDLT